MVLIVRLTIWIVPDITMQATMSCVWKKAIRSVQTITTLEWCDRMNIYVSRTDSQDALYVEAARILEVGQVLATSAYTQTPDNCYPSSLERVAHEKRDRHQVRPRFLWRVM
jgi:hypothetical protein